MSYLSNKTHSVKSLKTLTFNNIMFQCYFFFQILVTVYCDTGKERDCTPCEGPVLLVVSMQLPLCIRSLFCWRMENMEVKLHA